MKYNFLNYYKVRFLEIYIEVKKVEDYNWLIFFLNFWKIY